MYDDLEGTFKWKIGYTGYQGAVRKVAVNVYNGSASLQIAAGWDGVGLYWHATANRIFPISPIKILSFSCFFRPSFYIASTRLDFLIEIDDGTWDYYFRITYRNTTGKWYYLNKAGSDVLLGDGLVRPAAGAWGRIEFVCDLKSWAYGIVQISSRVVDLTGVPCYKYSSGGTPFALVRLDVSHSAPAPPTGSPDDCFYDDVFIREE